MARLAKPKRVIVYTDQEGNEPFTDWLYGLKDSMGRKRVLIRIARLEQGNYGDRGGLAKLDKLLSGKSATRNALRWA